MRLNIRSAVAISCALALPHSASALTIDNFEEGAFFRKGLSCCGAALAVQSPFPDADMLGGSRLIQVASLATRPDGPDPDTLPDSDPFQSALAELALTAGPDSVELSATGPEAGGASAGHFYFHYDGFGNFENDAVPFPADPAPRTECDPANPMPNLCELTGPAAGPKTCVPKDPNLLPPPTCKTVPVKITDLTPFKCLAEVAKCNLPPIAGCVLTGTQPNAVCVGPGQPGLPCATLIVPNPDPFDYDFGTLDVDLSSFDAIEVDAVDAGSGATLQLILWDGQRCGEPIPGACPATADDAYPPPKCVFSGPDVPLVTGTNYLLLPAPGPSVFGEADLTDIQAIRVRVKGLAGSSSASISEIRVAETPLIQIDLKPGSAVNCVNPDSMGKTTVAVLGSAAFDVTAVDPASLSFGGADAKQCQLKDVTPADGFPDLRCKVNTQQVAWPAPGSNCGPVAMTGTLVDEFPFEASDLACLTGEPACAAGVPPLP
jgi:hypothetical protein